VYPPKLSFEIYFRKVFKEMDRKHAKQLVNIKTTNMTFVHVSAEYSSLFVHVFFFQTLIINNGFDFIRKRVPIVTTALIKLVNV
jgi:hypothetical protein